MTERPKPKRCRECKMRFAGASGYCGPCRELHEERDLRARAEAALRESNAQLASQRKYRVHVPAFFWDADKTWPEAVAFAKDVAVSCTPWRVEIRDERGTVIRRMKKEGFAIVEVPLP